MRYIQFLTFCMLSALLVACAPDSLNERQYVNWRHSLGEPEVPDMKYAGNTIITKERKVQQIDPAMVRVAQTQGDYMEVIARQFRQDLLSSGAQVRQDGSRVYVYMPVQAVFGSNQVTIKPSVEPALKSIVQNLKSHPATMVRVIGHTDNSLGVLQSKKLSLRQAIAFASYLNKEGIDSERLLVEGFGSVDPIANNKTSEGRAKNCYIEMIVYNLQ